MTKERNKNKDNHTLKLRIRGKFDNGERITPDTLDMEKFHKFFLSFEKLINANIKSGTKRPFLSFNYTEGSASLEVSAPPNIYAPIAEQIERLDKNHPMHKVFEGREFEALTEIQVELGKISKDAKAHIGIDGLNTEVSEFVVDKDTVFDMPEEIVLNTDIIIYGKMTNIGGNEPNVHITTKKYGNVIIDINEQDARLLAKSLYREVGLRIRARRHLENNKIERGAILLSHIDFTPDFNYDNLNKDIELGTKVWKDIDTIEWVRNKRK